MGLLGLVLISCNTPEEQKEEDTIDQIAEQYVSLCLEIGHYDPDFVDAYYGPESLKPADSVFTDQEEIPFEELKWRAVTLLEKVERMSPEGQSEKESRRLLNLERQIRAVYARLYNLVGDTMPFDKESHMLYDAIAPRYEYTYYDSLLNILEEIVPGSGKLEERYNSYASQFHIPKDKLDTLFRSAIAEARNRTRQYMDLPENESFLLEYVTDKPWSGYNWYKGNAYSLIQINTDLPVSIDRVIDLASHEGYPGHHVFNMMIEQNLVQEEDWVEYSIYPLFSPLSLIAEGSANYGIDIAFPSEERMKYEKEVLWPIAELPISEVDQYYRIQAVKSELSYAENDIARSYFGGEIDDQEAVDLLQKYLLFSEDRAAQRLDFVKKYRTYVINYNYGRDLIEHWVMREMRGDLSEEKRWEVFASLLSFPPTASQLQE